MRSFFTFQGADFASSAARRGGFLAGIPTLFSCALLLALIPSAWGQRLVEDGYYYQTNNNEATLIRYDGVGPVVTIPSVIAGLPVKAIQSIQRFMEESGTVHQLVISEGVTTIGQDAFSRFLNLTNLVLPKSLALIGSGAFAGCPSLAEVAIPEGVATLGEGVFDGCRGLERFSVEPGNSAYVEVDGVLFSKDLSRLIHYPSGKPIDHYAIPETVTHLENNAFTFASNLRSLHIPALTSDLGELGLLGLTNLTQITVAASSPHLMAQDGILFSKDRTRLFRFPAQKNLQHYDIPAGVERLEQGAFNRCAHLVSVAIPDSVTTLRPNLFLRCENLVSVVFGKGVSRDLTHILMDCPNLRRLYFMGDAPVAQEYYTITEAPAVAFYLPGTSGWKVNLGNLPTQMWNPAIAPGESGFGLVDGQFRFTLTGNTPTFTEPEWIVEATPDLANPQWMPISTNVLSHDGTASFTDPAPAVGASRFYRFRVR